MIRTKFQWPRMWRPKPESGPEVLTRGYPFGGVGLARRPMERPGSERAVRELRAFADQYDVLRACIEHLKREAKTMQLEVVPRDETRAVDPRRLAQVRQLLTERDGPLGGSGKFPRHFLDEVFEDALVAGYYSVYLERDVKGRVQQITTVDPATIRPVTDGGGWATDRAYEQGGTLFGPDELIVDGFHSLSYQARFRSRVSYLSTVVLTALKADEWNRSWLTEGNVPDQLIAVPKEWSPTQLQEYAAYFDALLAGGVRERHRVKLVPDGTRPVWSQSRKDADFQVFERWMMQRTCAVMGVQPASIGFLDQQYKVTQEASMRATTQFGTHDLVVLQRDLLDELLRQMGHGDLRVHLSNAQTESRAERAERVRAEVGRPWRTVNEVRAEFGLPAVESGDQLAMNE